MANPNIIVVDGTEVRIHGRVEFEGSILSVPNNKDTNRLMRMLQPSVEGVQDHHTILFQDQTLPSGILLDIRAPRKIHPEG